MNETTRPTIDHEKEAMVLDAVARFLDKEVRPVAHQLEHDDVWPAELFEKMKEMGLFCCMIQEQYGRLGLSTSTYARIIEKICEVWMSVSGIINSHLIMSAVQRAGTPEQKERYLPRFASAEIRGGLALTEPDCGTDLQAVRTVAVKDGDEYVINGTKTWISNGIYGSAFAVLVKTDPNATPCLKGMSLFICEKGPDFTHSRKRSMSNVIRCIAAMTALACAPSAAIAQSYPSRLVRLVVAFPPGGGADVVARTLAQKLTPALGQAVVVDNRVGASGIVGTDSVAKSAADGYTLLIVATTQTIVASLYSKVPFDLVKDFAPVAFVGSAPLVLVVHPSLPVKSVKELVALARARPGQINYASPAIGTVGHLSMEMLKTRAKIDIVNVPYKGTSLALTDLLGGHVQAMFDILPSSMPHMKSGRLRPLAVTSATRLSDAPDIPTIAESGIPDYEVVQWYGVSAPARTPADVIVRLNMEITRALELPDVRERLQSQGYTVQKLSAEQFGMLVATDVAKWARVIKESGAKAD